MKGLFSIFTSFGMIIILASVVGYNYHVQHSIDTSLTIIKMQQLISEKTYQTEHGFRSAVVSGLNAVNPDMTEQTASQVVCSKVNNWIESQDFEYFIGFLNANDYTEVFGLPIIQCESILYVNVFGKTAKIQSKIPASSFLYNVAFVFKTKILNNELKIVIPEGTVIET